MTLVTIPRQLFDSSAGRGSPATRKRGTLFIALAFVLSVMGQGAAALTAAPVAAVDPAGAAFSINPDAGWISGNGFAMGASITVARNDIPMSIGDIVTDGYGNFRVDDEALATIGVGETIAVSDGVSTKETVVSDLGIGSIVDSVVRGWAADGVQVDLSVWGIDVYRSLTVGLSGTWSTDVSSAGPGPGEEQTTTLGPGDGVAARVTDDDGDATHVDRAIPNPRFTVNAADNWIMGEEFAPDSPIDITVNDQPVGGDPVVTEGDGTFWFNNDNDPELDLAIGDTITVYDGSTTKTTVVTGLRIDTIVDDVIRGWAEAGPVYLDVWGGEGVRRAVAIDTNNLWSTNVSIPGNDDWDQGVTSLHAGSNGQVVEYDGDGDGTRIDWNLPNPRFTVNAADNWIMGEEFAPDSPIDITVNLQPVGGDPVVTEGDGTFWFNNDNDPELDLAIGDTITVYDGSTTKTTVVTGLRIDSITNTTVSGWSETGDVFLEVFGWLNRHEIVLDHTFAIDVSVAGDEDWEQDTTTLGPGSEGAVTETDQDGDATQVDWRVPDPRITADLTDNGIRGQDFGDSVVVTITDPLTAATGTWSGEEIWYEDGSFFLSLDDVAGDEEPWRLAPGQLVTVEGASPTRTLTLADLVIGSWNFEDNTIEGTTNQDGTVAVEVGHEDNGAVLEATPAGGAWLVDFDDADPPYDLGISDYATATQFEDDGDGTAVSAGILGPPRFAVGTILQEIVGSDWPDRATVTLTIDRPSLPGEVDFTASVEAGSGCDTQDTCFSGNMPTTGDPNSYFNLTTGSFWVMAGDIVTMTDGDTIKIQVIPDIEVGLGEDDVNLVDDDGDSTYVQAPAPRVQLEPATDRVWAGNFAKGSVTITIERPEGTIVHTDSVETQNVLTRGSWNLDMWVQPIGNLDRPTMALFELGAFDLQAGDIVTVTDAETTDVSVVADLTVESISADTDIVSGHATGTVELHLGEGEGGYWGYAVIPDGDGAWSISFTAGVWPNPLYGLTPGMTGQAMIRNTNTVVRWTVPGSGELTIVTADDQTAVYGAALPELTWAASDGDVVWTTAPMCSTEAIVGSPVGSYQISCTGGVAPGYAVEYVDGTLEVTPAALVITATDASRGYGADNPTLEYGVEGLFEGDTLATPPTCTTTATPSSPVGTYPISCSGAADDNYEISYVEGTLTVAQAAQTINFGPIPDQVIGASPLTLVATSSSGLPVTLTSTTTSVCRFVPRNPSRLAIVAIGTCTVVASQAGDASYLAAEPVPQTFAVTGVPSTTTLTSNRATSVVGQPVKLTARVTSASGTPTGSVTFMDGTTVLGTRPLVRGSTSLIVNDLAVGLHDISAVYGGSSTYEGSTGVLAGGVTVAQAATEVRITNAQWLASWRTRLGESYEVNVRVTVVAPGSGTPAGTVVVSDGTNSCTITLEPNATGSCWLASTSIGLKTITVTYEGSDSYLGDTATATHYVRR